MSAATLESPYSARALCRAAAARRIAGEPDVALGLLERAILTGPDDAAIWAETGLTLLALGRHGEAAARLRRAIYLSSGMAEARNALGLALLRQGAPGLAAEQFAEAAAAKPWVWNFQLNLGLSQQRLGRYAEAAAAMAAAVQLEPANPVGWNAFGTALHQAGRYDEAIGAYQAALRERPDWPDALGNLGCALRAVGEPAQAIACYDRALAQQPGFAQARWNRALANLSLGRLAEAWEDHEWRWQVPGFPSPARDFAAKLWNGADIAGQTILLHAEQGFGDTLQALRYVAAVSARGAKVVLEVPRELQRLALHLPGVHRVLARGEALPQFDTHAPLLSLPRAFATTLETIPASIPYLAPPPSETARWRDRLAALPGLRVGLVWAGRPTHGNDANRSMALSDLTPLLAVPGVSFVSLQTGPRAADLAALPHGTVLDVSADLQDFADTAAALQALDALVSVDTSVVHLAGALGRPAHVLLPFAPDWRWLLGRADSPWYPSLRLRRQAARGDWAAPLASVAAAIGQHARHTMLQQAA